MRFGLTKLYLLCICSCYLSYLQADDDLDWLADKSLSCRGAFVEPYRIGIDDKTPLNQAISYLGAEDINFDITAQTISVNGDIKINISSTEIAAQSGIIDKQNNILSFSNNVKLRDRNMLLVGDDLVLNANNEEARLTNVDYVLHENNVHGFAKFMQRNSDKSLTLKTAVYSRCRPSSNAWYLQSNLIRLDPVSGFGSATNVVLRVKDVPVFYFPYIKFPIDNRRSSGFLAPNIGSSANNGLIIKTPYYLNLAANYDVTIYPSYLDKNGLLLENEFRYLNDIGLGKIAISFIDDNDNKRKLQSLYKEKRWLYNLKFDSNKDNNLTAGFDISDISDPYYLQDLPNEFISDDKFINQESYLNYKNDNLNASLIINNYKMATISDITPYNKLPHLNINGFYQSKIDINYNFDITNFNRNLKTGNFRDIDGNKSLWLDEKITGFRRVNGIRSYSSIELSKNFNLNSFYIKPSLSLLHAEYDLSLDNKGKNDMLANGNIFKDNYKRDIKVLQINSGLLLNYGNNKLEPKILAIYVPYKNQDNLPVFDSNYKSFNYHELWNFNRFSSIDRIGDTQQLSYGITYRIFNNDNIEKQVISLGRARYFSDQKVQLPGINYQTLANSSWRNSPYAFMYELKINDKLRLFNNINYQQETHQITNADLNINYHHDNKIFNVGYSYNNNNNISYDEYTGLWQQNNDYIDPITNKTIKNYHRHNQLNVSGLFPITNNLNFIANIEYDYNRRRALEYFSGITYNSCCWNLSVINRYWLDDDSSTLSKELNKKYNRGLFFQISLTGLGNISGNNVSQLLQNKIKGFNDEK